MRRRVLITGVGAVTPLGVGARALHDGWTAGRSVLEDGVGACRDFDATEFMSAKDARRSDRFSQLAIAASAQAVAGAGWAKGEPPCDPTEIGCVIGSGIGGMSTLESSHDALRDKGPVRVSPLSIPLLMGNAAAGLLAMRHGVRGPVFGVMSACASGAHAIGEAARMIESGAARAVISGGAEVVGELLGYAATSDAHHLTAPDPAGTSAALAITRALDDAGLTRDELDYVNAHGTSTPLNDRSETEALKLALGLRAHAIPVSSTKSAIGHLLGAAGAVEAVATVLALSDRVAPGLSAEGGAYSPAPTDWIVMTEESSTFLTGPSVVRDVLGEDVTPSQLGGARVHDRNGVCQFVTHSDLDATRLARELLSYLPSHRDAQAPRVQPRPPSSRHQIGSIVPGEARRVYDVRKLIEALVDGGELLEVSPSWARSIVTGLARIDGRTVGVIANQPKHLGGVLDAISAQKGARFVSKCHAFGIPLLVLVDTPGYMPGTQQESAGVIRFGASLVHAFAEATVPRVTVIVRKAFGGAYITMNSKDLGADYVFAWPSAEIGVMGARPPVGIIHRRELAAAEDPVAARERLASRYEQTQLRPQVAAAAGHIDELIEPAATRSRVAWALRSLEGCR